MEKIKIVTTNDLKFSHLKSFLGDKFDCEKAELDIVEIQGSKEEIIKEKLKTAFNYFKEPVLVDDTSLEIEELGGFPGPYIKDFVKTLGLKNIAKKFDGTNAKTICNLAFTRDGRDNFFAVGEISGKIKYIGSTGDSENQMEYAFIPNGLDKTLAETSLEKDKKYFNRYLAVMDLIKKI